jgi:hypothetical protein
LHSSHNAVPTRPYLLSKGLTLCPRDPLSTGLTGRLPLAQAIQPVLAVLVVTVQSCAGIRPHRYVIDRARVLNSK